MITTDPATVKKIVAKYLERKTPVAFDIETTGLNCRKEELVSVQVMQECKKPVIIDMREWGDLERWRGVLTPLFGGGVLVVGHNLKFDLSWMLELFAIRASRVFDTMLAEQVIYGGETGKGYGLKQVADRRRIELAEPIDKSDREYFYNLNTKDEWREPFPDRIITYMENDVQVLLPIFKQQSRELNSKNLKTTAQLELSLLPVVVEMEKNGINIDVEGWRGFIEQKRVKAEDYKDQVIRLLGPHILTARGKRIDAALRDYQYWEIARDNQLDMMKQAWSLKLDGTADFKGWGEYKTTRMKQWREENPNPGRPKEDSVVNIDSNQQLMDALGELGIPIPMKRKKGASSETESMDDESLKTIEHLHPAITLLRKYRKEEKFCKSYGEELLKEQCVDGRFHFSYSQMVSTGRMSASRIQQIPARGDGKELRKNVVAAPGWKMVVKDFNAAEMRILAEISRDVGLIRIFRDGLDIHSSIARDLFRLGSDVDPKVTIANDSQGRPMGKTYRDIAKTVEYSCVYGTGPTRLAQVVGCDVGEAKEILKKFLSAYPGVEKYLQRTKQNAINIGESRTLGNRARFYYVPEKPSDPAGFSEWKGVIASIERAAGNAPIQGTNADITKAAAVKLYQHLLYSNMLEKVKLVGIIHDEIVLEVREDVAEYVGTLLADAMEYGWNVYMRLVGMGPKEFTVSDSWEH